jgi:hypothetical protein
MTPTFDQIHQALLHCKHIPGIQNWIVLFLHCTETDKDNKAAVAKEFYTAISNRPWYPPDAIDLDMRYDTEYSRGFFLGVLEGIQARMMPKMSF